MTDCVVNSQIMALVLQHYNVPAQPDGKCNCEDPESHGAHQADHLIEKINEHFNLDWIRP